MQVIDDYHFVKTHKHGYGADESRNGKHTRMLGNGCCCDFLKDNKITNETN